MRLTSQSHHRLGKGTPTRHPEPQRGLFATPVARRVNLAVEIGIVDLDLVGANPDNGAIFFVQLDRLPEEST
jgi:hypothetical protein